MDESRNTSIFYPDPAEIHIADDIEQERTTTASHNTPYNSSLEQMDVQLADDEVQEVKDTQIIGVINNNKRGIIACVFCTLFIILGMSLGFNIHHISSSEDNQQNMEPSKVTESPIRSLAPQTFSPATFEPDTLAPETLAPQTLAPQTLQPETLSPDTSAPQTLKPETFAPDTLKPETLAPETLAPQTLRPQTLAPATFSPSDNPSNNPSKSPTVTLRPIQWLNPGGIGNHRLFSKANTWYNCRDGYVMIGFNTKYGQNYYAFSNLKNMRCVKPDVPGIGSRSVTCNTQRGQPSISNIQTDSYAHTACEGDDEFIAGFKTSSKRNSECTQLFECWDKIRCCKYDDSIITVGPAILEENINRCFRSTDDRWCDVNEPKFIQDIGIDTSERPLATTSVSNAIQRFKARKLYLGYQTYLWGEAYGGISDGTSADYAEWHAFGESNPDCKNIEDIEVVSNSNGIQSIRIKVDGRWEQKKGASGNAAETNSLGQLNSGEIVNRIVVGAVDPCGWSCGGRTRYKKIVYLKFTTNQGKTLEIGDKSAVLTVLYEEGGNGPASNRQLVDFKGKYDNIGTPFMVQLQFLWKTN